MKESLDRVLSSLSSTGYSAPRTRVTINLAPGDLRKEGAAFDLPIALCLLAAMGQIPSDKLKDFLIAGELGLSGETRRIRGGLSMAMLATKSAKKGVVLPRKSAEEACLVEGVKVYPMDSLAQAVSFFAGIRATSLCKSESPYQLKHDESGDLTFPRSRAGGGETVCRGSGRRWSQFANDRASRIREIHDCKENPIVLPMPDMNEFLEILNIYSAGGNSLMEEGRR